MIKIELDDKLLQRALSQISSNAQNTKPLMVAIGAEIISQTDQNLKSGIGADGQKFKPWSESWAEQRKKMGKNPGQILLLKALLAKSINRQATNNSVTVGTNVKYARIHQLGGQAGRNRSVLMPARPYLPVYGGKLQRDLEPVILDMALTHLAKGV